MRRAVGRHRGRAAALAALVAAALLGALLVATPASASGARARIIARLHAGTGVSLTRSASRPHWACPHSLCLAIVDPRPSMRAGRYALPGARPMLEGSGELGGYDPADLQSAYAIPEGGGESQTVAVVDAFGYPSAESDLAKYRERYGLPACTKASGCFRKLNQHGEEANYPPAGQNGNEVGWEVESALDIEMVSAACPACHVMLVEGNDDNERHLAEAVDTAVGQGATEVSNSYGIPEEVCSLLGSVCQEIAPAYSHPGVVITAAAGDYRYDYSALGYGSPSLPATLPSVIAVGGTALHRAANARGWSETVWDEPAREIGTGSGCSISQPKPPWQSDAACATRMTNDVSADAACATAVSVYTTVEAGWLDLCGTSASSPLLAAILAHAGEQVRSLGAQAFYEEPTSLFDVLEGSNGTCTPPSADAYFCHAEAGYDGPTGLGTPDGLPLATGPSVSGLEPREGPQAGGTTVTISGFRLSGATAVDFGSASAAGFTVEPDGSISAVSPAGSGTVDVTVTTPEGTSPANLADRFAYQVPGPPPTVTRVSPKKGAAAGSTSVTITGTRLTGATAVSFGGVQAATFTVNSATSITVPSPPGTTGTVDVTVTTPDGASAPTAKDHFKYGKPLVGSMSPSSGPTAGGAAVTITGSGFALGSGTSFLFGKAAATAVSCSSTTLCTATSPAAGRAGTVEVRALVAKAKSPKSLPGDEYKYE